MKETDKKIPIKRQVILLHYNVKTVCPYPRLYS